MSFLEVTFHVSQTELINISSIFHSHLYIYKQFIYYGTYHMISEKTHLSSQLDSVTKAICLFIYLCIFSPNIVPGHGRYSINVELMVLNQCLPCSLFSLLGTKPREVLFLIPAIASGRSSCPVSSNPFSSLGVGNQQARSALHQFLYCL